MNILPYLHYVVIKEEPESMAFDDGDVMATVGTTERKDKTLLIIKYWLRHEVSSLCCDYSSPATVYNNCHQIIHAIRVGGITRCVEKSELQWENNTIGQFGVAMELVHVLKAFQVEGKDHG